MLQSKGLQRVGHNLVMEHNRDLRILTYLLHIKLLDFLKRKNT